MRHGLAFGGMLGLLVACTTSGGEPPSATVTAEVGKACKKSSDCASDHCVARIGEVIADDVDGICTKECSGTADCLGGWSCIASASGADLCQCRKAAEACDGLDNDCNGRVDDHPGGICSCAKTVCGDRCVDLATDSASCGACGVVCPEGTSCVAGACACPGGLTVCRGVCVDTTTDNTHCGACNATCGPATRCGGGACRCGTTGDPCDTERGKQLCGGENECHDDSSIGGLTIVDPYSIAVGDSFVAFAQVASITGGGHYATSRGFDGSQKGGAGPFSYERSPRVAAAGPDFVYALSKSDVGAAAVLVACRGATCGDTLVTAEVGRAISMYAGAVWWVVDGELRRCAVTGCGGTPETVAAAPGGASALVVDASGAYAAFGGSIARWTQASGAFETLFDAGTFRSLAVDDTNVYAATSTGIVTCAKTGCGGTATPFATAAAPSGIAVRGAHVYWVTQNVLYRCAKASACVPKVVASGFTSLGAEDATHLYLTQRGDVHRVSK